MEMTFELGSKGDNQTKDGIPGEMERKALWARGEAHAKAQEQQEACEKVVWLECPEPRGHAG